MTLPKNINDHLNAFFEDLSYDYEAGLKTPHEQTYLTRAALEAAIAAAIQPVEPPTDAEVEAWRKIARPSPEHHGFVLLDPSEVDQAVALMRRARATGSLERLRDRVKNAEPPITRREVLGWIDEERGAGR